MAEVETGLLSFHCIIKNYLLGIKWYHHVLNDEVRWTTGQPHLSAIVQARHFSLFGHITWMPGETYAKMILAASLLENWRTPL